MARSVRVSFIFLAVFFVVVFGDLENYEKSDNVGRRELRELYKVPRESRLFGNLPVERQFAGPLRFQNIYSEYKRQVDADKEYDYDSPLGEPIRPYDVPTDPEFTYHLDAPAEWSDKDSTRRPPFAHPPSDAKFYGTDAPKELNVDSDNRADQGWSGGDEDLDFDFVDTFSEPRQHRQNPNLAANKLNKVVNLNEQSSGFEEPNIQRNLAFSKFTSERDIPTSLVPTSARHQHVLQQSMRRNAGLDQAMGVYIYAMVAGVMAAATVAIAAFAFGWYTMQKKMKSAADAEYPAYGVTGPNPQGSPSGDRRLAHSAQLYHYQHQKQQIIAMENRAGVTERNGSVSDAESEDENEEGDYTVYECPGFATTGELEVKNPLFLDEPTPATPATGQNTSKTEK